MEQQQAKFVMSRLDGLVGTSGVTKREREFVPTLIPIKGRVLEVGTYDGATVAWWAKQRPEARFLSVDPFRHATPDSDGPLGHPGNWLVNQQPNMSLFVGTLLELLAAARPVRYRFDLVFVDGSHAYRDCRSDIEVAWQLTDLVLVHDYHRERLDPEHPDEGVTLAVDEFAVKHGLAVEAIDSIAVLRRA